MQKLDDQNPSYGWFFPAHLSVIKDSHVPHSFAWFWLMVWNLEICLWFRESSLEFQPTGPWITTPPTIAWMWNHRCFLCVFFRQRSNGLEYSRRSQIFNFQNLDLESLLTKLNSTDLSLFQHQLSGKKVQLLLSSSKVLCARCRFYPNWNERSHFVDSSKICLSKVDWRNSGTPVFFVRGG